MKKISKKANREADIEERVIAGVVAHWFCQGGEAQFGDIGKPRNSDEVIAEILRVVREQCPPV